jgi:GWxTD domain-containing protein
VPNPERLYGLYADSLRAEIVARAKPGDERPWHWVARVLDSGNRAVATVEADGPPARWLHAPIVMGIASQPAGGYELEVKAWQEGDAGALLRRSRFSVGWQPETWTHSPQDILDDAHFLLPPEEEETFGQLQPGEQERALDDFWRKRDPTPETAENEVRRTFLERVDFANRTFGRRGLGKGMFSDMGRVFIRYGEPGEVLRQVIPTLDNTLVEVIQQLAARDQREVGGVEQRQLGADMRPFELWIYEGEIPLPPDVDPTVQRATRTRKRLVFLFVDEQWVGDYRLRYSTE